MNEREIDELNMRFLNERLDKLDEFEEEWLKAFKMEETNFTSSEIGLLRTLAEKNMKNDGGQGLNNNQRQAKRAVQKRMRNSLSDLDRMARFWYIGAGSPWKKKEKKQDRLMFKTKSVSEDLPVAKICTFIECLVRTYGDRYAVLLANSIAKGLSERESWESGFEVDVPVIRRSRSGRL
jgi:hypothetical protein